MPRGGADRQPNKERRHASANILFAGSSHCLALRLWGFWPPTVCLQIHRENPDKTPSSAMSNPKNGSAYGAPAGDTDFRKTWDLDEYAEKAKVREAKEKEEGKARYEAKMAGKKYYKPKTGDETYTSARRNVMDFTGQVGKTQLVGAGAGVGKRGRGAGFYCEACDLTFKDNLQVRFHNLLSMQSLLTKACSTSSISTRHSIF